MLAQGTRLLGRVRGGGVKILAFAVGVAILYHEIWIASSAEPLLVFLGLWLIGVSPASFFDELRKLNRMTDPDGKPTKRQEDAA